MRQELIRYLADYLDYEGHEVPIETIKNALDAFESTENAQIEIKTDVPNGTVLKKRG